MPALYIDLDILQALFLFYINAQQTTTYFTHSNNPFIISQFCGLVGLLGSVLRFSQIYNESVFSAKIFSGAPGEEFASKFIWFVGRIVSCVCCTEVPTYKLVFNQGLKFQRLLEFFVCQFVLWCAFFICSYFKSSDFPFYHHSEYF